MMRQRKDTAIFHTCTDCTPGNEITDDNPELFAAAEKTIDTRLSAGGGPPPAGAGPGLHVSLQDSKKARRYMKILMDF